MMRSIKNIYYELIYRELEKSGWTVFREQECAGIIIPNTTGRRKWQDGLYLKRKCVLIGEIKSDKEISNKKTWWSGPARFDAKADEKRNSYGGELSQYRKDLESRLSSHEISLAEAGHMFFIMEHLLKVRAAVRLGYVELKNRPRVDLGDKDVRLAYTVPNDEEAIVSSAIKKMGYKFKIMRTRHSVTFLINIA